MHSLTLRALAAFTLFHSACFASPGVIAETTLVTTTTTYVTVGSAPTAGANDNSRFLAAAQKKPSEQNDVTYTTKYYTVKASPPSQQSEFPWSWIEGSPWESAYTGGSNQYPQSTSESSPESQATVQASSPPQVTKDSSPPPQTTFVTRTKAAHKGHGAAAQETQSSSTVNAGSGSGNMHSASISGPEPTNWSGPGFQQAILESTNKVRANHQGQPLTWNASLASSAMEWANTCNWDHNSAGQNLAEGYATPAAAVEAWAHEQVSYNYADPGFTESSGHYTQIVWLNTRTIGCAAANCNTNTAGNAFGEYLVCNYWPPGNVIGAFGENVKPGKDAKRALGGASKRSGGVVLKRALVAAVAASSLSS